MTDHMGSDGYFYRRAETELAMAQRAASPAASKAHYELANRYLDRFYNPAAPRPADIVGDR
jgi:hypothetical protein